MTNEMNLLIFKKGGKVVGSRSRNKPISLAVIMNTADIYDLENCGMAIDVKREDGSRLSFNDYPYSGTLELEFTQRESPVLYSNQRL